jgi:Ser/Thr protein kinase RdoA (MazF antagonist)
MVQGLLPPLLARYPPRIQPVSVVLPMGSAGGHSGAALWRYSAVIGDLAIRAWPAGGPSLAHVTKIHGWLQEAVDHDQLPLPVPVQTLDGRTVCELEGRCWEIAPWMPGAPDLGHSPALQRIRAAFTALAHLHRRLSHHQTMEVSPGLRFRVKELEDLADGEFDRLEATLARHSEDDHVALARRWLVLARAALPRVLPLIRDAATLTVPVQPCLRDARPEHFLFEGDRLTGLIDFGAMGPETVAADLARLLGEWLADLGASRSAALAAYEEVRPLDPGERALITPFEAAADLLIAGHWISWHFVGHRTFDEPNAVCRGINRGLARLARLTDRIAQPGVFLM